MPKTSRAAPFLLRSSSDPHETRAVVMPVSLD